MKDNFEIAKEWVRKQGGIVNDKLVRRKVGEYYGIFAKDEISKEEVLVSIPNHLFIGEEKIANYKDLLGIEFETEIEKVVSVFLYELCYVNNSIYQDWFQVLPTYEDMEESHPYLSTKIEKEQFKLLCSRVVSSIDKFEEQTMSLKKKTKDLFSIKDIKWAYCIYLSRAFEDCGLIPFCDLFNHNSILGRGLDDNNELRAKSNIKLNSEVYISYGDNYDTLELWLNFGFYDERVPQVVGCSNIKDVNGVSFDDHCFITDKGPSRKLQNNCLKLGGVDRSEVVYNSLLETFKNELNLDSLIVDTQRTNMCLNILTQRSELIEREILKVAM